MRLPVRALPLLAAALLCSCVSLDPTPMAMRPVTKDNRLLLLVYAAPGPVMSETDSKAETAAKIMPGLGLIVKDTQDQRDLKAAQRLQQYLPPFDAAKEFEPAFRKQVASLGLPSKLIGPADTDVPAEDWLKMNEASDQLDWQVRYYIQQPAGVGVSRDYSRYLSLDDVVVLEVDLLYGLDTDDEQYYTPNLKAVTKLLRANTMHELWRHENIVTEPAAKKTLYEFETRPQDLLGAWKHLMPALGLQMTDDLRKSLSLAGVNLDPRAGLPAMNLPGTVPLSGAGWAPAPIASAPAAAGRPSAGSTLAPFQPAAPSAPGAFTPRPSTP